MSNSLKGSYILSSHKVQGEEKPPFRYPRSCLLVSIDKMQTPTITYDLAIAENRCIQEEISAIVQDYIQKNLQSSVSLILFVCLIGEHIFILILIHSSSTCRTTRSSEAIRLYSMRYPTYSTTHSIPAEQFCPGTLLSAPEHRAV